LRVSKHSSGVRHYEIGEGIRAVGVEMRTSLMLVVPDVRSESRLVRIWMAAGLTNWFNNFVGLIAIAYD